jgi:hypothetical protein
VRFDGSVRIAAPREKVWTLESNPHAASRSAPGGKPSGVIILEEQAMFVAAAHVLPFHGASRPPQQAPQRHERIAYSGAQS